MASVTDLSGRCKLTLTDGRTGAVYQVEPLPRQPGEYRRGFRLAVPGGPSAGGDSCHAHQLPCGLTECSCPAWTESRTCAHTQLLTAAGLFDELVTPDEPSYGGRWFPDDDELVDIDWESEAP